MKKQTKGFVIIVLAVLIGSVTLSGCIRPNLQWVEMRDGVKLATDVYLPKNQGEPHGTILVRTPYNKDVLVLFGSNWAKQGWPTVIQDMRGRFASQGNDTVFFNSHTDGPDTASWIGSQDWSNGKVATFGGSALGNCQYYMAGANPPELACQFIQVATPDMYEHGMYWGGEFREMLVVGWLTGQGSTYVLPKIWENENFSLDVWTNVTLRDNWQDIHVPAVHIGGWYDIFTQGTIDGFMGYHYLGGAGAVDNSKLIVGPWTHGGAGGQKQGELTYPENCKDTFSSALFWEMTNEYTMGIPGNYDAWPAVYYYVMGDVDNTTAPGNEWRESEDWPITYSETPWYFDDAGGLSLVPPTSGGPLTYIYNPNNPVPTVGGGNLRIPAGPYDQSGVENRSDVLVFTSNVLTEPYEATGPIKAHLFVSSDAVDTDFTVKLTDVYPDGRSMLITDGILRMRNRNGSDHWEFMTPGDIYEIDVDIWSASYIWNTGHRIRVDISSSNYPRFLNNPNTADGIHANTTYVVAQNTLYMDSTQPSHIVFPEITMPLQSNQPSISSVDVTIVDKKSKKFVFEGYVSDPDNDQIYVQFNWGDGSVSGWLGPYDSGELFSVTHQWKKPGNYRVRYVIKDTTNTIGEWKESDSIMITHVYGQRQQRLWNFILDNAERFPRLHKLISLSEFDEISSYTIR